MVSKRQACHLAPIIVIVCILTSCETASVHRFSGSGQRVGNGPPSHAQAHGYQRKQIDGREFVYDSALGVYVMVDMPFHYYCDGHFYRIYGGLWDVSARADGDWAPATIESLPAGLQKKAQGEAIGHQNKVVASATRYKSRGKQAY